ncbi:MAG: outer membrane lipid asymmetry maintenance protein MlaD [Alphaproteobacteria bacterium]|nr:outer membrane lipid asymmetry maintenance protein MlaD [Alphaproteobacteria bacterium]
MRANHIETVMGLVVLAVAGGFLTFAYKSSHVSTQGGYTVSAKFDSVDGLGTGSDVRIGGVKIGTVSDIRLEPDTYKAAVSLGLAKDVKIPADSTAAIVSDGLLGSKYLSITPGGDEKNLKNGEVISYTQSSVNLEQLIGKFMFSGGGVDGEKKKDAPAQTPPSGL